MKKISLILGIVAASCAGFVTESDAQLLNLLSTPYNLPLDTAVNTTVTTLTSVACTKDNLTTSIVVNVLKISGTAAGTVVLQGSNDNTNFRTLPTAVAASFTVTDIAAAQGITWVLTGNPYRYYRVQYTPTGTMSASFSAQLWSH